MRLQLNLDSSTFFCCKTKAKKRLLNFIIALVTRLSSTKWKEANGKPDKSKELILKTKADLKERPNNI